MVCLHPSNFNNAIAILNNLKTSKKDTRLRGDVYLLIKNTCSAKMKSMCISLDARFAIEQHIIHVKSILAVFQIQNCTYRISNFGAKMKSRLLSLREQTLLYMSCILCVYFWSKKNQLLYSFTPKTFFIVLMKVMNCSNFLEQNSMAPIIISSQTYLYIYFMAHKYYYFKVHLFLIENCQIK